MNTFSRPTPSRFRATALFARCLTFIGLGLFCAAAAPAAVVSAVYENAAHVPVTADGYTATGNMVDLALGFTPVPGTSLTVVNNTGLGFIDGTFDNLANGQTVTLNHGGTDYDFVAWYYGGTGNDLVLLWSTTDLAGWGRASNGRLAIDQAGNVLVPTAADPSGVLAGKTLVQVSRGLSHTLALTTEGKVYAWGNNTTGQLGINSTFGSAAPVAVFTDTGPTALAGKFVIAVATTRNTSYALSSDGTIAAWGENQRGQLGNGTTGGGTNNADVRVPVAVNTSGVLAGKTVVALAGGTHHILALCSDGTVAAWGSGGSGQLGNNSSSDRSLPELVNTASGTSALFGKTVVAIAGGGNHSLALSSDGTVVAWGSNSNGQLGDNSITSRNAPVAVNTTSGTSALFGKTVTAIAAGNQHSIALNSDGTVATWGRNNRNQLGNNSITDSSVPVAVNTTSGVSALFGKSVQAIAAGLDGNLALTTDGAPAAWGYNQLGQVGDGVTSATRAVPTAVNVEDGVSVLAGKAIISLADSGSASDHFMVLYADSPQVLLPDIAIEQPFGTELLSGATSAFGVVLAGESTAELTYTINNLGFAPLTGLGTTFIGPDAADFSVTQAPSAPVAASGSTTFTVTFAPLSGGLKSATLQIASNDSDESPFNLLLSGTAIDNQTDTDGDGLNDAAEYRLASLGFDWQVTQIGLVEEFLSTTALFTQSQYDASRQTGRDDVTLSPNTYGLFNLTQVQALNVGTPLLQRTGPDQFKLTIAVEKTTSLSTNFAPLPMSASETSINAQGELEFLFTVPEDTAFFRLEAK